MKVAVGLRRVAAGKRTSGRRAAQIASKSPGPENQRSESLEDGLRTCAKRRNFPAGFNGIHFRLWQGKSPFAGQQTACRPMGGSELEP